MSPMSDALLMSLVYSRASVCLNLTSGDSYVCCFRSHEPLWLCQCQMLLRPGWLPHSHTPAHDNVNGALQKDIMCHRCIKSSTLLFFSLSLSPMGAKPWHPGIWTSTLGRCLTEVGVDCFKIFIIIIIHIIIIF